MRRLQLTIILGALLISATIFATLYVGMNKQSSGSMGHVTASSPTQAQQTIYTYKGQNGVDALTLLKKQTSVEKNSSGLVTSINGRKADDKNHEYWAFYVNGKYATMGPAQYITKNGDTLLWKIEKY